MFLLIQCYRHQNTREPGLKELAEMEINVTENVEEGIMVDFVMKKLGFLWRLYETTTQREASPSACY